MTQFSELDRASEIIEYQKQVLSRTGGRKSEDACIYHYTNIEALMAMVQSDYMWLSPANKMNDILEAKVLHNAGINDLYYACFSRCNQNIAMFKMYAPNPNGVMLSISLEDAKKMAAQKPRIIDGTDLLEAVDVGLYWIGVCYKDLDRDRITTPTQGNRKIKQPLKELAGAIKLSGWDYEKEVRLCARKRLYPEQRLAVRLPQKMDVVLCPGFEKSRYLEQLSALTMRGINYHQSQYDEWASI